MLEVKVAKVLYGDAYKNITDLKGSEKQVAWASDIRDAKIAEIFINNACIKNPFFGKILVNIFKRQDSARFWIDNRDRDVVTIARYGLRDEVLAEKNILEAEVGNVDEYNKNFAISEMRRLYCVNKVYFAKSDELAKTFVHTQEEKEQKRIIDHVYMSAKDLLDDYKRVYPYVDFETAEPLKFDNAVDDNQISDLAKDIPVECDDDNTLKIKIDTARGKIEVKVSADFVNYEGYLDYDPEGIDDTIELLDVRIVEGYNAHIEKLYRVPANDIFTGGFVVMFIYNFDPFTGGTLYFPPDMQGCADINDFEDAEFYFGSKDWISEHDIIFGDIDYSKFLAEDYGYDFDDDDDDK